MMNILEQNFDDHTAICLEQNEEHESWGLLYMAFPKSTAQFKKENDKPKSPNFQPKAHFW